MVSMRNYSYKYLCAIFRITEVLKGRVLTIIFIEFSANLYQWLISDSYIENL